MKARLMCTALAVGILCHVMSARLSAQESSEKKISNVGLKLNLGLGSQDFAAAQDLEQGGAASLSLGYGVSQRVALWLGVSGSSHTNETNKALESGLASLELSVQYKLRPGKKLQPYGKVGLGGFILHTDQTQVTLSGGGVTWGLGAEYRLARFLSVGGEFFWKDFDYTRQRLGDDNDFQKLPHPLQGNSRGFMLNFTLQ